MTEFAFRGAFFASEGDPGPLPADLLFEKFVTIAIFKEPVYAYVSKAVLEVEGIGCSVCDEYTGGMSGLFTRRKAGYKLRVRESEAEKAIDLLLQESVEE